MLQDTSPAAFEFLCHGKGRKILVAYGSQNNSLQSTSINEQNLQINYAVSKTYITNNKKNTNSHIQNAKKTPTCLNSLSTSHRPLTLKLIIYQTIICQRKTLFSSNKIPDFFMLIILQSHFKTSRQLQLNQYNVSPYT